MLVKIPQVALGVLLLSCLVVAPCLADIDFSGHVNSGVKLTWDGADPLRVALPSIGVSVEAAWSDVFKLIADTSMGFRDPIIEHLDLGAAGQLGAFYGESFTVFGAPVNRDGDPLGDALFVRLSVCSDFIIAGVDAELLFLLEDTTFDTVLFYAIPAGGTYTGADQNLKTGWALTLKGTSFLGVPFEAITNFSLDREASGSYGFIGTFGYPGKVVDEPCLSQVVKLKNICYFGIKLNPEVRMLVSEFDPVEIIGATTLGFTVASLDMTTSFEVDLVRLRLKMGRFGVSVVSGPVNFSAYLDQAFEVSTTTFGFTIQGSVATLRTSLGIKPGEGLRSVNANVSFTAGLLTASTSITLAKETQASEWLDLSRGAVNFRWITTRHTFELTAVFRGYPTEYMEWGLNYTYKF